MTIHVLGLGESLATYKPDGNTTIGVNDIFKFHPVDYLVLADRPHRFSDVRLECICSSTPKKFFVISALCEDWEPFIKTSPLHTCEYRGPSLIDNPDRICYSNNSAFLSVCVAHKMKATTIIMHGVDFNTHPNFKDATLKIALKDFKELREALNKRGVRLFVSSKLSKLSNIIPVYK